MPNRILEEHIENIKHDKLNKPSSTLKKLRPILKAFNSYSTTADQLPPQTLIPTCLFVLPKVFKILTGVTEDQVLEDQPQNAGLKLCLQHYLKGLLRLLGECDEEIRHIVVQSMFHNATLVLPFRNLAKKWVKTLVTTWASSNDNLNLSLRCFLCLQKILTGDLYIWGLRRVYVGYFEHCSQVNWRTLEHINFMCNCFCELAKQQPNQAYYVLFGYIRSLAVQIQSLNNLKGKEKQALTLKLYSQQTIQIFKLLGQLIGTVSEELSGLIYPLIEVMSAYQKISESNEYIPLKLHILEIELRIMESTELYLPHTHSTLIKILSSSALHKKHNKKGEIQGSIELGYKLSFQQLKNTQIINDIFDKTVYYLYWFLILTQKMIGGVEITNETVKLLSSVELGFIGHQKVVKNIIKLAKNDAVILQQKRRQKKMTLSDKKQRKFQQSISSLPLELREKYQEIKHDRQYLFKAKLIAEQEQEQAESQQDSDAREDQEELESGWEQASEGASEFEESQALSSDSSSFEGQSYEGDPQEPEKVIEQWSEHSWSSQQA